MTSHYWSSVETKLPRQGFGGLSHRVEQFLLLCYYDPRSISTVPETIASIQRNSRFSVAVLNLFDHRWNSISVQLHDNLNLDAFDGVIIHNSLSCSPGNLRMLDERLRVGMAKFTGVKVLFQQDVNYKLPEISQYIVDAGIDLVLTHMPSNEFDKLHPSLIVGGARFSQILTGYVTPTMRCVTPTAGPRPIDIGYRGSVQPFDWGRLAYEKSHIGQDVLRFLAGRDLTLDISSRPDDRFGGGAWFDFLGRCKATLGAESCASVFDLDGALTTRCREAELALGPNDGTPAYEKAFLVRFADLERDINCAQLSPRHFEAASTRTLQILFPGSYSGIFEAGRHYFALERDYSNLEDAVNCLRSDARRDQITTCAYEEIILNPKYWIETFVTDLDDELALALSRKNVASKPRIQASVVANNVLLLCSHKPRQDPRLGWYEECAPEGMRVHQLGIQHSSEKCESIERTPRSAIVMATPMTQYEPGEVLKWSAVVGDDPGASAAVAQLLWMERAMALRDADFLELCGATFNNARIRAFKWYMNFFLDVAASLIREASNFRGVHAIIAADLTTICPALILGAMLKVPVVFDAHEYWPEADLGNYEFEQQFWASMECKLIPHARLRVTVSTGLAELMFARYGSPFLILPNAEPLSRGDIVSVKPTLDAAVCTFLFQGGFSLGRGIDLLIQNWAHVADNAHLYLRGPDGPYKEEMVKLAKASGLFGIRIFFPEPVDELALVEEASRADVGVIPYAPIGANHQHCCPNKTSQYMAAGVPIFANDTTFVKTIVETADAGVVVDFTDREKFVAAVSELVADAASRRRKAENGRRYFRLSFNWEALSGAVYKELQAMVSARPAEQLQVFGSSARNYLQGSWTVSHALGTSIIGGGPGRRVSTAPARIYASGEGRAVRMTRLVKPAARKLLALLPTRLQGLIRPLALRINARLFR